MKRKSLQKDKLRNMKSLYKIVNELVASIEECDCGCDIEHNVMNTCLKIHKLYTHYDAENDFENVDGFHDFMDSVIPF